MTLHETIYFTSGCCDRIFFCYNPWYPNSIIRQNYSWYN